MTPRSLWRSLKQIGEKMLSTCSGQPLHTLAMATWGMPAALKGSSSSRWTAEVAAASDGTSPTIRAGVMAAQTTTHADKT